MAMLRTWLSMLTLLLVFPVIAAGGAVSVCNCRHQVVYAGQCGCAHGHVEEPQQPQQQQQHHCFHLDHELRMVSGQVDAPVFSPAAALPVPVPDFRTDLRLLHSQVAWAMERSRLWVPPDIVAAPLLI